MKENLKNEDFDNSSELLLLGSDINLASISNMEKFKKIVTSELEQELRLQKRGLNAIYFHRYAQSEDNWNKIVDISKEWLSKWPYLPLNKEKKSILELFRYEDVSLWWFVYISIWETKNGIFDTIYHILTISNLINHYKPKKILCNAGLGPHPCNAPKSFVTLFIGPHLSTRYIISGQRLSRAPSRYSVTVKKPVLGDGPKQKVPKDFFM